MEAVNWGSTRSGKCLESQAATIMPLRVGTEMEGEREIGREGGRERGREGRVSRRRRSIRSSKQSKSSR